MKYILFTSLVAMMLLGSCKDPCKDVTCVNGDCIEGTCNCIEGYEGADCSAEFRAKYFGTWTGPMECDGESPLQLDGLTVVISAAETGIYDLKVEITANSIIDIPFPTETTTLVGGVVFKTGPTTTNLLGNDVTGSSTGIFEDENTLNLDVNISLSFNGIPIALTCSGILTK